MKICKNLNFFWGKFYNFPRKSFYLVFKETLLCLEYICYGALSCIDLPKFLNCVYIKHNCQAIDSVFLFTILIIVSVAMLLFWANWKEIERMILKLDEFKSIEITIWNHHLKLNEQQNKKQSKLIAKLSKLNHFL